jgi:hypothetical protein
VPTWTSACAIVMTDLGASGVVARPILTRVVGRVTERPTVRLRAGHDVVQVEAIENASNSLSFFIQGRRHVDVVAYARGFERVAM